jgi:periplasmic copper chaperone A
MRAALILLTTMLLTACGSSEPKQQIIEDAWVRLPAATGRPAAAYFTISGGSVPDRLMGISSPLAVRSELHDMSMKDGVMSMAEIKGGVDVPRNDDLAFKPGGKHAMLFDLSPKATAGTTIPLTFSFASGATLSFEAKAVAAGDEDPHAH